MTYQVSVVGCWASAGAAGTSTARASRPGRSHVSSVLMAGIIAARAAGGAGFAAIVSGGGQRGSLLAGCEADRVRRGDLLVVGVARSHLKAVGDALGQTRQSGAGAAGREDVGQRCRPLRLVDRVAANAAQRRPDQLYAAGAGAIDAQAQPPLPVVRAASGGCARRISGPDA